MPNIKAAKKSLRQDAKKEAHNRAYKDKIKNIHKEMLSLVASSKNEEAAKLLPSFFKAVDKAAKRNIIPKNTTARRKALMYKRVIPQKEKKVEKK